MEKTLRKIDIWTIFTYLIIYSIAGLLIETIFGMFTKGVIESRKSFLYGPFCTIYGIGSIAIIILLRDQKSVKKIFFGGALIGASIEYLMSFICERFFGVKWWDYSDFLLNVNGRICLFFTVSWGILSIVLLKFVNPQIDKIIEKLRIKNKLFKIGNLVLIILFCLDAFISAYTLKIFYYRIATENDLDIANKVSIANKYYQIENSKGFTNYLNEKYDNEIILKNYPNMMIEEKNNKIVYIGNLINEVEPYYYRISDAIKNE